MLTLQQQQQQQQQLGLRRHRDFSDEDSPFVITRLGLNSRAVVLGFVKRLATRSAISLMYF